MEFIAARPGSARSPLASEIVLAGDWAFLSGVAPIDFADDRAALPEMVEAQTLRVLANAETLLKTVGMARQNLVSVRVHLVNYAKFFERVNDAYVGFFPADRLPARSCIGVSHVTRGALVEMDFVACRVIA